MSEVPERIPDYVGIAKRDPDGRALRLAMQRAYRVNIMEAGNKLFVDLLPPSWIGAPPSLPKHVMRELSLRALEAERKAENAARQKQDASDPYKLKISLAKQPTFTRVVFGWNKFVTADLSRRGRKVALEFGRNAKADLSRLKVDPPKYLRGAKAKQTETGMKIELVIDGDVDVRGFREGNAYVLDLTGPDDAEAAAAEKAARALPRPAEEGADGEQAAKPTDQEEITLAGEPDKDTDGAKETAPAVEVETLVKSLESENLLSQDFADAEAPLPPGPGSDRPESEDAPAAPEKQAEQAVEAEQPVEAKKEPESEQAKAAPDGEEKPKPDETADAKKAPVAKDEGDTSKSAEKKAGAEPEAEAKSSEPLPGVPAKPKVTARLEATESQIRLTFPFDAPVASTVFRRGKYIWLVFDSDVDLDVVGHRSRQGQENHAGEPGLSRARCNMSGSGCRAPGWHMCRPRRRIGSSPSAT